MKIVQWIFGLLFAAIIPTMMALAGTGLDFYLDIPSLFIVLCGGVFLSIMSHGPREFGRAFRLGAGNTEESDTTELRSAIVVLEGLRTNLYHAGVFGVIIGLVGLLTAAEHAEKLAAGAAVMILTLLYAVIANMLFVLPFIHRLRAAAARKDR